MKKIVKNVSRRPIKILGQRIEVGEAKEIEITRDVEKTFGMGISVEGIKPSKKKGVK